MKLYGYALRSEADQPTRLREATIATDPATLRRIARFLLYAATEMETYGDGFDHRHLQHFDRTMPDTPQLVVSRNRSLKRRVAGPRRRPARTG